MDQETGMVIVVEDNADNELVLHHLLTRGVGITKYQSVSSGKALIEWATTHPSSEVVLVLLDLHLPKEDGYNVLRQIRQTPHLGQTKVVAVTADIMNSQVERCKAAGFNGFLGKPISAERFPAQIQRLLNGEYVWEPH